MFCAFCVFVCLSYTLKKASLHFCTHRFGHCSRRSADARISRRHSTVFEPDRLRSSICDGVR